MKLLLFSNLMIIIIVIVAVITITTIIMTSKSLKLSFTLNCVLKGYFKLTGFACDVHQIFNAIT